MALISSHMMRQRLDEIATIMTMEQGKPLFEAKVETNLAADIIDWMADDPVPMTATRCPVKSTPSWGQRPVT